MPFLLSSSEILICGANKFIVMTSTMISSNAISKKTKENRKKRKKKLKRVATGLLS